MEWVIKHRTETCKEIYKKPDYILTHPHHIYELLAEHGALGSILILYIIFYNFRILKQIIMSKNYIQMDHLYIF